MFGANRNRAFGGKNIFGKKDRSAKKERVWMRMKKKNEEKQQQPAKSKLELDDDDDDDNPVSVMMSADSSPTLQASIQPGYVELPDEPRPGKITPSTHTSNSTPSPRASKSEAGNGTTATSSPDVEDIIEEAVPIVRATLPSPEPRPLIERNGYKDHVDSGIGNNGIKKQPKEHDVDDVGCLIKCVYFTQQCCECTIV